MRRFIVGVVAAFGVAVASIAPVAAQNVMVNPIDVEEHGDWILMIYPEVAVAENDADLIMLCLRAARRDDPLRSVSGILFASFLPSQELGSDGEWHPLERPRRAKIEVLGTVAGFFPIGNDPAFPPYVTMRVENLGFAARTFIPKVWARK